MSQRWGEADAGNRQSIRFQYGRPHRRTRSGRFDTTGRAQRTWASARRDTRTGRAAGPCCLARQPTRHGWRRHTWRWGQCRCWGVRDRGVGRDCDDRQRLRLRPCRTYCRIREHGRKRCRTQSSGREGRPVTRMSHRCRVLLDGVQDLLTWLCDCVSAGRDCGRAS